MHEAVADPVGNGSRIANAGRSAATMKATPLNRSLSTTRHIGNAQIRVFLPEMGAPKTFQGVALKQYTRLPNHRPPLRRDKPVRISLPDHPPRYIYPAVDRSFIFIPRAMRPNQQGFNIRGKARSGFGSIGGFSRRGSMYGGSIYGSVYSPSVAMSRRSSLAHEVSRDSIVSPSGSTMSRPPMPVDSSKPIVRLPPPNQFLQPTPTQPYGVQPHGVADGAIESLPRPQAYPLPQNPTFRENRDVSIPMHQPRPQKTVSVADIESPVAFNLQAPQQQQQPFHQQVPPQVNGNAFAHDMHLHPHSRKASYPGHVSTGTPLSQIPERAIHAQPFQPSPYQHGYYAPPSYPIAAPPQQDYYYPQQYPNPMAPPGAVPAFVPSHQQQNPYQQQPLPEPAQDGGHQNLVAQELNGMVYYYDAAQIPAVATFPAYPAPAAYPMTQVNGVMGMGGMMTPSPDGFYYPQATQGVVYYPQ